MLHTQEYLLTKHTFDDLKREKKIFPKFHPTLPLVSLKYLPDAQLFDPITIECRGLILHSETFEIVSKGFDRFFNHDQVNAPGFKDFFFHRFNVYEKKDGSIIYLFYFDGMWRIATSNSFGFDKPDINGPTWTEIFWSKFSYDTDKLNKDYTYVIELQSPFNVIVEPQTEISLAFLGCFEQGKEIPLHWVDIGLPKPLQYDFLGLEDAEEWLNEYNKENPHFEGFVFHNSEGSRFKLKGNSYRVIQHSYQPKLSDIVDIYLDRNTNAIIHDKHKDRFRLIETTTQNIIKSIIEKYHSVAHLPESRDAYSSLAQYPFTYVVMQLRKLGLTADEETVTTLVHENKVVRGSVKKYLLEMMKGKANEIY